MKSRSRNHRRGGGSRKRFRQEDGRALSAQPATKTATPIETGGPDEPATSPGEAAVANRLPAWKRALFAVITVAGFFVLLEAALAIAGVEPVLYRKDPFVGFSSNIPLFVEEQRAGGQHWLVTASNKTEWFNAQRFPRDKPPNTVRIFSVGGSTTYGRPYTDLASFSGWLREMLPTADPSRRWEVINAGGISYASYRVAALLEELAHYEPDVFLIYTGHNEFLERRTYGSMLDAPGALTAAGGLLSRTRIYAAGATMLAAISHSPAPSAAKPAMLQPEVDTILDHSIGPTQYKRDDTLRRKILTHFRFNLSRMIDIAHSAGARVVLIAPAANLKDCSPFKSEHRAGLGEGDRQRFDALSGEARKAQSDGRLEDALAALRQAKAIDDSYAQLHYQTGQVLYAMQRYEEAKAAFARALDDDICPLRALEPIQQIVREVAARRNVPLLDFEATMEDASENGIPGKDYFLDHVHMNLNGYRLLALRLLDTLDEQGIAKISDGWNEDALAKVTAAVESRIDKRQQGIALRNLAKVFNWAGKHEESERLAIQAAELLGEDAESYALLGLRAAARGETQQAIANFRKALRLQPGYAEAHFNLGLQLAAQNQLDEAIAHFRRALSLKPDYAVAHGGLAEALVSKGEPAKAVPHYREAIRLQPNYAEPRHGLGLALIRLGRKEEAIRCFQEALRINPSFARAHNSLGIALISQGAIGQGIVHFREAIRIQPDYAEAHANLGSALASRKQFDEAIGHYKQALHINPRNTDAQRNLGLALLSQGQPDEALQHFRKALRIDPDDARTHYATASALDAMGRPRASMAHLQQAARLKPDWPPPLTQLAWTLATAADPDIRHGEKAVRFAEQAARLTKHEDPVVLETLAAAYAETGHFKKAIQTADQALAIAADGDELAADIQSELEFYKQGRPYRESMTSP
jgi:tetratricopeptide (TPR) repeat protein